MHNRNSHDVQLLRSCCHLILYSVCEILCLHSIECYVLGAACGIQDGRRRRRQSACDENEPGRYRSVALAGIRDCLLHAWIARHRGSVGKEDHVGGDAWPDRPTRIVRWSEILKCVEIHKHEVRERFHGITPLHVYRVDLHQRSQASAIAAISVRAIMS